MYVDNTNKKLVEIQTFLAWRAKEKYSLQYKVILNTYLLFFFYYTVSICPRLLNTPPRVLYIGYNLIVWSAIMETFA